MQKKNVRRIQWYLRRSNNRRIWKKIVQTLACIVVFITTYALMLPAITLETTTYCAIEDHVHDQSCYQPASLTSLNDGILHSHDDYCYDICGTLICPMAELPAHQHGDACYETVCVETEPAETVETHTHSPSCYGSQRGELKCALPEQEGHAHEGSCYMLGTEPLCGLTEGEIHFHGDACYRQTLVCQQEELAGHTHETACYTVGTEPVCQSTEGTDHIHGDDCYEKTLTCQQEEMPGHAHEGSCYSRGTEILCTLAEGEAHVHKEGCYEKTLNCQQPEQEAHAHTNPCYEWQDLLVCGKEETTETTVAAEPQETVTYETVLTCPKTERTAHTHTAEICCDEAGALICEKPQLTEHQHTAACLSLAEENQICELAESEEHTHSHLCYRSWSFLCQEAAVPETEPAFEEESAEIWEATFSDVVLMESWPENVVQIAKTQLGYTQADQTMEDGSVQPYTRYGHWYGMPNEAWDAMFVSFCLDYAGVENFPVHYDCDAWIEQLRMDCLYQTPETYDPKPGDLIFFDWDQTENSEEPIPVEADHVGIVAEVLPQTEAEPARIKTIEGDVDGQVCETVYQLDDIRIIGYGQLPEKLETYSCGQTCHCHIEKCFDETGALTCQLTEHTHDESCLFRKFTYSDDTISLTLTLTGAYDLPEDLQLNVYPVTEQENTASYNAMRMALGEAMFPSEDVVGAASFYRMELLAEGEPYTLPENVKTNVEAAFAQPVFTAEAVAEAVELRTFTLTEMPAEVTEEAPAEEEVLAAQPMMLMAVNDIDMDSEPVADEPAAASYQAAATPVDNYVDAENGITGLQFESGNAMTFAVALTSTVRNEGIWQRVTAKSQLTSGDTYMIISAEGTYALTGNSNNRATQVNVEMIKGNPGYYTITDDNGTDISNAYLQWTFSGSSTYTIRNVGSRSYLNMGSSSLFDSSSVSTTLTALTDQQCWEISQRPRYSRYYLHSSESYGFTRDTDNDVRTNYIMIFKLVDKSLSIPDDVISGSGSGSNDGTDIPKKPEYKKYIEVTGGLAGDTTQGNVKGEYYSDPATSQLEALFSGNTDDNGKALSDKSVIYKNDDYDAFSSYEENTFGVTLSALGQEYLVEETTLVKTPVDVVFVLDVSGSMKYAAGNVSRAEAMVSAVNSAINDIMKQNPENRVGVTLFSSGAWDLLELGHYQPASNGKYLYTEKSYMSKFREERYRVYAYDSVRSQVSQPALEDMDQANGTYTQAGIAKGAAMLQRVSPKTYTQYLNPDAATEAEKMPVTVKRQPVIILLSDGEPTHCTSNYKDVLSGPHYGDGVAKARTDDYKVGYQGVYGYYTILSANYYKRMVEISYDNPALFYTVGMGISEDKDVDLSGVNADSDVYKRAVLNPTVGNITKLESTINSKDTVVQLKALMQNEYTEKTIAVPTGSQSYMSTWMGKVHSLVPVLKNPYPTNYSYAEGAYFGEIDTEQLTGIFNEILLASYRVNSFGFILHNRSAMMIEDPLGVGMEVKSDPILRYEGVNYTHTSTTVEGNKTTYVYDYDFAATDGSRQTADLSTIKVEVIQNANGTQTVHLHIPDMVLPAYSPYLYVDAQGQIPFYYEALPIRLIYQVGLTEKAQKDIEALEDYGGKLTYYTNFYAEELKEGEDTAHTDMTPTNQNPYYKIGNQHESDHGNDKSENVTDTDDHSFECHHDKMTDNGEEVPVIRQDLGNNGKLVFEAPRQVIDIPVEKKWSDPIHETSGVSVDIELYSVIEDTVILVRTLSLNQENQWKGVFDRLPKLEEGGFYALRERVPAAFAASYTGEIVEITLDGKPTRVVKIQGQNPIEEELVTVTNSNAYVLPSTGGMGTQYHTIGGTLLLLAAAWLYICKSGKFQKKGGRHGR